MRKRPRKRNQGEIDYWQPTSDLLISLLLVLLLVILLLGLYLLHTPETINNAPWDGDASYEADGIDDADGSAEEREEHLYDYPEPPREADNGGGNGDGDGSGDGSDKGPGEEPDEGIKSAVFVMLIDTETKRTIKEAGVEFELYSEDNGLQILNTYYPEKISYRKYETTENGTFYLPEKVFHGGYYLRELTAASGYDMGEDQHFLIKKLYDWPEPYLVQVPVFPSQNVIRVQMNDQQSGLPLSGGRFEVVAAENIITQDGTLRYNAGQVVGEIVCGEDGSGQSEPLYLGKYKIRQSAIPDYYAGLLQPIDAAVAKKTDVAPDPVKVLSEKTRFTVTVSDELQPEKGLEGVEFEITGGTEPVTKTTDRTGKFTMTDLEKGVSYRIRQVSRSGDYLPDGEEHVLSVSANGLIDNKPSAQLDLTNRLIRVTVSLKDALLGSQINDVNLALYDSSEELVHTWTTTGVPVTFTDLPVGNYTVVRDGDKNRKYLITVEDTAQPQSLEVSLFTWRSAAVAAIAVLVAALLVAGSLVVGRSAVERAKKKQADRRSAKKTQMPGSLGHEEDEP